MDPELALFFDPAPAALPLYLAFQAAVCAAHADVHVRVQRTQISFSNRYGFACVSLPRRKAKAATDSRIVVSFGLPYRLSSPRVDLAVEPYPGRFTHHVTVARPEEIDAELMGWICAAYDFSAAK